MAELKATGITNLYRSTRGVYYWLAKIGGVPRKGSLKTKSKSVAKSKLWRSIEVARARYEGREQSDRNSSLVTLGDWAAEWLRREQDSPNIKPSTKYDYEKKIKGIEKAPVMSVPFARLGQKECAEWWRRSNEKVAPVTANARYRVFHAVIVLAMEETGRTDNPARKLKRKPVRRTVRKIPRAQEIRKLLPNDPRPGETVLAGVRCDGGVCRLLRSPARPRWRRSGPRTSMGIGWSSEGERMGQRTTRKDWCPLTRH